MREKMMKRCVLYSRVSTEKQQCLNQVLEMTEYTKRSDLEIVKTYQDDSTSSRKDISQRTQLSQMLSDANRKLFDVLVVSSIDRIARNTKECIEIINQLNELNIDIIFLREGVDTRTSIGRMIFHVFSSLGEYEREMIRERIMSGLNRAREQGKKLGRKTKINESLITAVRLLRDKEMSIRNISKELNIGVGTIYKIL
jgi:DNA invertase Pin-like site-specific DNA recombinase